MTLGGHVVKAQNFSLDEAASCIDLMHPKMDRGLLEIEGLPLLKFKQHILGNVIPLSLMSHPLPPSNLIVSYSRRLLMLSINWYSGLSAADVFFPCLILHRPQLLQNDLLQWLTWVALRSSLMLADIVVQMHVAVSDEFLPNLYSLIDNRIDISDNDLINWFNINFDRIGAEYGRLVLNECLFHYRWMTLLQSIKSFSLDYQYLSRILSYLLDQKLDSSTSHLDDQQSFFYPIISNLAANGCVRRRVRLTSSQECLREFYGFIRRLLDSIEFINKKPPFYELFYRLIQIQSIPLQFIAIQRSFFRALLFRNDQLYGTLRPGDLSLQVFNENSIFYEAILMDSINILCSSPSRQRRHIPKFIIRTLQLVMGGREKIQEFLLIFAQWFIILGFHLELYEPFEEVEAHWWLIQISHSSLLENSLFYFESTKDKLDPFRMSTYNDQRFIHRWECLLNLLPSVTIERLHGLIIRQSNSPPSIQPSNFTMQEIFKQYRNCFLEGINNRSKIIASNKI